MSLVGLIDFLISMTEFINLSVFKVDYNCTLRAVSLSVLHGQHICMFPAQIRIGRHIL